MSKSVITIFGAATLGNIEKHTNSDATPQPNSAKEQVLAILDKYNVKDLDTAYSYVCLTHSPVTRP